MDATGSKAATTVMLFIVWLIFCNAVRGIAMTASRVLLAFGRDGMVPYGKAFTHLVCGEPVLGTVVTVVVALIVGLVQLGPEAAFNSLLGSAAITAFMAYGTSLPCPPIRAPSEDWLWSKHSGSGMGHQTSWRRQGEMPS